MPLDLQQKIGREIEPCSIMPLLDGEASGSGTLVTIDCVRGILTAGHVVRNWHEAEGSTFKVSWNSAKSQHDDTRLDWVPISRSGRLGPRGRLYSH
jgi:hypothetical protein